MSNAHSGMTLMELVVVMGLVSILLFAAIPRLIRPDKEANPGVHLKAWIARLKEDALRNGREYVLSVDLDNHQAWIDGPKTDSSDASSSDSGKRRREDAPETVLHLSDGVTRMAIRYLHGDPVDSGIHEIRFYPQGYSSAASIWFEIRDGKGICLKIEPFLGEPVLVGRQTCEG